MSLILPILGAWKHLMLLLQTSLNKVVDIKVRIVNSVAHSWT